MSDTPQHTRPDYFEDKDEVPDLTQEQMDKLWKSAQPVLGGMGKPVMITITPTGGNPFYEMYKKVTIHPTLFDPDGNPLTCPKVSPGENCFYQSYKVEEMSKQTDKTPPPSYMYIAERIKQLSSLPKSDLVAVGASAMWFPETITEQQYEYAVSKGYVVPFYDVWALNFPEGIEPGEPQKCGVIIERNFEDEEPIHIWFELSYAQYLTIPRSVLQSMPISWQRQFAKLLDILDGSIEWRPKEGRYWVRLKDANGRFVNDPLMDYQKGRRRIPLKTSDTPVNKEKEWADIDIKELKKGYLISNRFSHLEEFYDELTQRYAYLTSSEFSPVNGKIEEDTRINEINLSILRIQQMMLEELGKQDNT